VIAIRNDLLDFITDTAVHSISHEGSFSRVTLLVQHGISHLYSVHAPIHPPAPPDETFHDWVDSLTADINAVAGGTDSVYLGGDWNFAWDSIAGYFPSRQADAAWQAVDLERREYLEAAALTGPSAVHLTHTFKKDDTLRRSQYDFYLARA
jgi:hypothetical protein